MGESAGRSVLAWARRVALGRRVVGLGLLAAATIGWRELVNPHVPFFLSMLVGTSVVLMAIGLAAAPAEIFERDEPRAARR